METEMDALYVLNEDCWREVFRRVDSRDLKSCSQTCFAFHLILSSSSSTWKLDQILPHLLNHLDSDSDPKHPSPNESLWRTVLNCRLACRAWSTSIDKYLESHPEHHYNLWIDMYTSAYQFDETFEVEAFLTKFKDHPRNPFIGRQIALGCPTLEEDEVAEAYNLKIQQLGARFGGEVWTLWLVEDWNIPPVQNHRSIQKILSCCPNLRNLHIYQQPRCREDQANRPEEDEVVACIKENPLPPFPLLGRLHISGSSWVTRRAILGRASGPGQLRELEMDLEEKLPKGVNLSGLSCLKELTLKRVGPSNTLQILRGLQSPLDKLAVELESGEKEEALWPIDLVLKNCQHLPLTYLSIQDDGCGAFIGESGPPHSTVQHAEIKQLKIECGTGCLSFSADILLLLPNVENVSCRCMTIIPSEEEGFVGLRPYHDRPEGVILLREYLVKGEGYKSNVWEKVPFLKTLKMELWGWVKSLSNYTRKEYEKRKIEN